MQTVFSQPLTTKVFIMSEVQEKPHVPSLPLEQEKAGLAEHKEVASTPERASSTNDLEQVVTDEDHFNNTPWSWKDRIAALSLAGLYVGKSTLLSSFDRATDNSRIANPSLLRWRLSIIHRR